MLLYILAVLAGFIILAKAADHFVQGAASIARHFDISPLIIGLTVVGFGTSAPEILVSVTAAWQGTPILAVGNAIGSNIANIALVLGITAMIAPLSVHSSALRREMPLLLVITLFALVLMLDQRLGRLDGLLLLAGLVVMIYWLIAIAFRAQPNDPLGDEYAAEMPAKQPPRRAIAALLIGLAALLISSRLLVWGAIGIAQALGISELVIGLSMVAIGTSLPELATCIAGARQGEHDIAIGNIIGSNMFNTLAVLGVAGAISPTNLPASVLERDLPVMIGVTLALFVVAYGFRHRGRITRIEGGLLLACFAGYQLLLYNA